MKPLISKKLLQFFVSFEHSRLSELPFFLIGFKLSQFGGVGAGVGGIGVGGGVGGIGVGGSGGGVLL